jgi:3-phosphoglycerate kinase
VLVNGAPGILPAHHPAASRNRLVAAVAQARARRVVCGETASNLYLSLPMTRAVEYVFAGGGATLAFLAGQFQVRIPDLPAPWQPDAAGSGLDAAPEGYPRAKAG